MPPAPPRTRSTRRLEPAPFDDAVPVFARLRPRLRGIAQRITGRWTEAEDVVQEAWLRWQLTDRTVVRNPEAFLVTTTTRLALNVSASARVRRETQDRVPSGEPIDPHADPAAAAERRDALEHGILALVRCLSPAERGAYVLRHAFEYPFAHIADVLQTSEPNARQLVRRAGRRLATGRGPAAGGGTHEPLLHTFVAAARLGEPALLEQMFATAAARPSAGRRARTHDAVGSTTAATARRTGAGSRHGAALVSRGR